MLSFCRKEYPDRTEEVCDGLGATIIKGDWREEHEQRNVGLAVLDHCDWVLVNDADMWFERNVVKTLLEFLSTTQANAVCMPQWSYWYDTDHVLVDDDFTPVVAVRPKKVKFCHIGCVDDYYAVYPQKLHHLCWCRPKDIYKKVTTYSHSPELEDLDNWYQNSFCKWQPGQKAAMPKRRGGDTQWVGKEFDVLFKPLPRELKKWLP
jgi:hypothetical protein